MKSLRKRILLGILLFLTIVFVVGISVIYSRAKGILYSDFQNTLCDKAYVLSALTEYSDEGLVVDIDDEKFTKISNGDSPLYFVIVREVGTVLRKSSNLNVSKDLIHRLKGLGEEKQSVPFVGAFSECQIQSVEIGGGGIMVLL